MTVYKEKTCACGHAASFHMKNGKKHGRCLYGHDRTRFGTTVAPCTCMCFHRRASPLAAYAEEEIPMTDDLPSILTSQQPEVLAALDDIIAGFTRLRRALPMKRASVPVPMPVPVPTRTTITPALKPKPAPLPPKTSLRLVKP